MKYIYLFVCLFGISSINYSCKNESKETTQNTELEEVKEKPQATQPDQILLGSVLAKTMMTPELKTFVSFLITTEKVDLLSKEDGPYTVFAPTNEAFKLIDEKKMKSVLNPKNRKELNSVIENHIVAGNLDSSSLVQNINSSDGSYEIQTLSGTILVASQDGTKIVLTDPNGQKAVIGKSDIIGSNGVLHVVNTVLAIN